jgi:Fe-S-cluster containining protein
VTAIAIRPKEQALQFRRCTGHCCDPVTLNFDPGYFAARRDWPGDTGWIAANLEYLGWRPPSMGGWPNHGTFEYRCPHFDRKQRRCRIYGTGKRSRMCCTHPEYRYGPWEVCTHDGCTRRTVVLGVDPIPLRWRFPDLWKADRDRWDAWEQEACRPEWGADAMPAGHDE